MFTQNRKEFRKVAYICLTLLSTALPGITEAADSSLREGFFDSLKKEVKLLVKNPDPRSDFQTSDNERQRYVAFHNSIVDKYSERNPMIAQHRILPKPGNKMSNLVSASMELRSKAEELKRIQEEKKRILQKGGEIAVEVAASGVKSVIESKVREPEIQSSLLDLADSAKEKVKLLFENFDTRHDKVQSDLQTSENKWQRCVDSHNSMVDKYSKQNPMIAQHRILPKLGNKMSNLVSASMEFRSKAEELKRIQEEKKRILQKGGEIAVEVAASGVKSVIESKVREPEIQSSLLDLTDNLKEKFLNFLKQ